jgi:hypothetical protein
MSKSKNVTVSKKQLTETGEELEVVGAVAEVEGAVEMIEGEENLEVAKVAGMIAVQQTAAASSDLTRAADAALVADRVQDLSEIVAAAGVMDISEGVDMLMKGGDVKAMGAIVSLMSREELDRGLELARLAGELWTVSDVVGVLQMPVLAEFLEERGMRLQEIAADQLLRFTGTRALAGAIKQAGQDVEAMGEQEVTEGLVRLAVSEAAAERSAKLSAASDALAARAVDEMVTAEIAGSVAKEAAVVGVVEIAKGAELMGTGEAVEAMGEALEERAS